MNTEDGRQITSSLDWEADVVVVGSGPGGSAVARELARAGAVVAVVEEGHLHLPEEHSADAFTAMHRLYRNIGTTMSFGAPPMPIVQPRAVGGGTVIYGAISWRLPRDVYDGWVAADPALADTLPWEHVDQFDEIEESLGVAPTDPAVAGPNNLLLAKGAAALGLEHRPIRRPVRHCEGLGRCLQGCPIGAKQSMDRTWLKDAVQAGARVLSGVRVDRVEVSRGRVIGVRGTTARVGPLGGQRVRIVAPKVVVCAGAVQSPALLLRSGLSDGIVGTGFMAHPGVSVVGRFAEPVRVWRGATQGHEVTGLRREGIKIEAMGYDMALVAARAPAIGRQLADQLSDLAHHAHWGAAIRSTARGRVRSGRLVGTRVSYSLTGEDVARTKLAIRTMADLMFAAGAEWVAPGVATLPSRMDPGSVRSAVFPNKASAYTFAATHLFGTCRLGSDPSRSVVNPSFEHHRVTGLYVGDASVFPTNTGVNPATSILALGRLCGRSVAGVDPVSTGVDRCRIVGAISDSSTSKPG